MKLGGFMNTSPDKIITENRKKLTAGITARFIQIGAGLVFLAGILFLSVGNFLWPWAWIFLGIYLVSILINGLLLLRIHPETVAERGRPKDMKTWDKIIAGLWSLAQFLLIPLLAGLDYRWGWSSSPDLLSHITGVFLFALGLGLFGWAMVTNSYFSTIVRIQHERSQMVCDQGPYRFVRHPGYVGTILQSVGIPLLLGSYWALIPGAMAILLILIRAALEDHMLQADLPGYADYAQQVRYRILPGIW
jgi:protein-S-isoprenylcysteine O-methyltransferase Ste14